ncbi:MAG TPA: hypothetical protein DCE23_05835 [Firmicutes bacterium]|nr:hypothetical protein [Bacillota bacterium]
MVRLTGLEKERLTSESYKLSQELTNIEVDKLNKVCNSFGELFQGINFGTNECEKINSINKKVSDLYDETNLVLNEIKILINESEVINESQVS